MRQSDRKMCLDVSVKTGAKYTNHNFVCATLRMNRHFHVVKKDSQKRGRYEVAKLLKRDDILEEGSH